MLSRRRFCQTMLAGAAATATAGCGSEPGRLGEVDLVWGRRGVSDGRFQKPRAISIDAQDRLYIVDMTARIQVFDTDGEFLRSWRTPESSSGRPTGLSVEGDRLLVADTHYYRVLPYNFAGELQQDAIIGGTNGHGEGEFGFVTDVVRDSAGAFYIAEYGDYDRIQKFSPEGEFLLQWGSHGGEHGEFVRPQCLYVDSQDMIWVCDSCNHRLQVFSSEGKLQHVWGTEGSSLGELYYPYAMTMDAAGNIYVCEYGNSRVQKFTTNGKSLGAWGAQGRGRGELLNPWAMVLDSQGRMHVLDSYNHRVQRVLL